MKELKFTTSNEIQIMSIIKDIFLRQYRIKSYLVDKENNCTTFYVVKKESDKTKLLTQTNEKR